MKNFGLIFCLLVVVIDRSDLLRVSKYKLDFASRAIRIAPCLFSEFTQSIFGGDPLKVEAHVDLLRANNIEPNNGMYEELLNSWISSSHETSVVANEIDMIFDTIFKCHLIIDEALLIKVFRYLIECGRIKDTESYFTKLSNIFAPNALLGNMVIEGWCKSNEINSEFRALDFLNTLQGGNVRITDDSYINMIKTLNKKCTTNRSKIIFDLFESYVASREKLGIQLSTLFIETAVISLAEEGKYPSYSSQSNYITTVLKSNNMILSWSCYEQLILRWVQLLRKDTPIMVNKLLSNMVDNGYNITPILPIYIAFQLDLQSIESTLRASEAYLQFTSLSAFIPDISHALRAGIVLAWCKQGYAEIGEYFLTLVNASPESLSGISSSIHQTVADYVASKFWFRTSLAMVWNTLIAAYGKRNRQFYSNELLHADVFDYHFSSTTSTFISKQYSLGLQNIISSLRHPIKESDDITAKTEVDRGHSVVRNGDFEAALSAEDAYNRMTSNIEPNYWTYHTLITLWCQLGYVNRAELIFQSAMERMSSNTSETISSLIQLQGSILYGWTQKYIELKRSENKLNETLDIVDVESAILHTFEELCIRCTKALESTTGNSADWLSVPEEVFNTIMATGIILPISCVKSYLKIISVSPHMTAHEPLCSDVFNSMKKSYVSQSAIAKDAFRPLFSKESRNIDWFQTKQFTSKLLENENLFYFSNKVGKGGSSCKAIDVFRSLLKSDYPLDSECYEYLFESFIKSTELDPTSSIPERALDILQRIQASGVEVPVSIYLSTLVLWSQSQRTDSARIAEGVFRMMISCMRNAIPSSQLQKAFECLLQAWACSSLPNAVSKSLEIFQTMLDSNVGVTGKSFVYLAQAHMNSFRRDINRMNTNLLVERQRHEQICNSHISDLEELLLQCLSYDVPPPKVLLDFLLEAWSLSGSKDSYYKVYELLILLSTKDYTTSKAVLELTPELFEQQTPIFNSIYEQGSRHIFVDSSFTSQQYNMIVKTWPTASPKVFLSNLVKVGVVGENLKIAYNWLIASCSAKATSSAAVAVADALICKLFSRWNRGSSGMSLLINDTPDFKVINTPSFHHPRGDVHSLALYLQTVISHLQFRPASTSIVPLAYPDIVLNELPQDVAPDENIFNMMIDFWKTTYIPRTILGNDASETYDILSNKAHLLFDKMLSPPNVPGQQGREGKVSTTILETLINIWSHVDVYRSIELLEYSFSQNIIPSSSVFSQCMTSLIRENMIDSCEQLFYLYLSMKSSTTRSPDNECCMIMLTALASEAAARSIDDDIGERANRVFERINQSGGKLSGQMTLKVLTAWSHSKSPRAARKAEEALKRALMLGVQPAHQLFNKLLDIYGKSETRNCTVKSEEIVRWMQECGLQPNLVTYNSVLSAWAKSRDPSAETKAFSIFDKVVQSGLSPDAITYTSLLSAIRNSRDPQAAQRADAVFQDMLNDLVEPDVTAFTILLSTWSKSNLRGKEDRVQQIYESMLKQGVTPNAVTYTTLLSMWGSSTHPGAKGRVIKLFDQMAKSRVCLDLVGYSSLLSAISRSRDRNAPYRADEVFEQMLRNRIAPDVNAYTILISIWSRSNVKGRERKIEQIYNRMVADRIQPTAITYTSLLNCWASCKHPQAKNRIIEIYERLCGEVVELDVRAYEALLSALRRTTSASTDLQSTTITTSPINLLTSATRPLEPFTPTKEHTSNNTEPPTPTKEHISSSTYYLDRVEHLLMRSLDFGLLPSPGCWATVIEAETSGESAYIRALRLYNVIVREGVTITTEIIAAMLRVLSQASAEENSAFFDAKAIVDRHEQNVGQVPIFIWNMYINVINNSRALSLIDKVKYAIEVYNKIKVRGVRPNEYTQTVEHSISGALETSQELLVSLLTQCYEIMPLGRSEPGLSQQVNLLINDLSAAVDELAVY